MELITRLKNRMQNQSLQSNKPTPDFGETLFQNNVLYFLFTLHAAIYLGAK